MQTSVLYHSDNLDTLRRCQHDAALDLVAAILENQAVKRRLPQ